jgi:hypothetical protein
VFDARLEVVGAGARSFASSFSRRESSASTSACSRSGCSATDWLSADAETSSLQVGYFGTSTGASATLVAAAERPETGAVVSRGGRPDLAGESLGRVRAPRLLIVGGTTPRCST